MLFTEYQEPIEVWRMVTASGRRSDPVWTLITTVSGRFEPVVGDEEFLSNQTFANISEVMFLPYSYRSAVQAADGIRDADGVQRKIVGVPEVWKYMLQHVLCKLERTQWTVVS